LSWVSDCCLRMGDWFDRPMEEVQTAYGRWLALTGTSGGIL